MATVLSPTDRRIIMQGVSWQTYERLLADFAESHAARLAFDQGTLEIMAPSFAHERPLQLVGQIVEILAEAHELDIVSAGSTTFQRADLGRGVEPDASFYIQHAPHVRGNTEIDLDHDPPPDLVNEIDITHPTLDKFPIYAAVGVSEVWRYAEQKVGIYRRQAAGYTADDSSAVLPGVTSEQLTRWLTAGDQLPLPEWRRQVRAWAEGLSRYT